ncbi:hypothetical protein ACHAXT_011599 [Thalassiosira profunda]
MGRRAPAGNAASVYVSRLRRAFLLQVHPDRFRGESDKVKRQQAKLVQALSDRMAERDFLAYTASTSESGNIRQLPVLNRDQWTLSSSTLQLDKGPHHILEQMAKSINFASPPPPAEVRKQTKQSTVISGVDQILWGFRSDAHHGQPLPAEPSSLNRNVLHFLQNVDFDEIKQRKLDRIHATAAALVARRAYKLLAVDGTGLGWSSASLAVCLSRLTDVHEEHKSKLCKSFYPFRLVLGSDVKVDKFGGNIHINPTRTNIQWLGTLMTVTDGDIRALKQNKKELEENLVKIAGAFGLRCVKGFSCEPEDYHRCIRQLALDCHRTNDEGDETSLAALSRAKLVVESAQACRRPKLRKDGSLEISANMGMHTIRKLLAEYTTKANELVQKTSEQESRCQEIVSRAMYEFGVQKGKLKKISSDTSPANPSALPAADTYVTLATTGRW